MSEDLISFDDEVVDLKNHDVSFNGAGTSSLFTIAYFISGCKIFT